MILSIDSLPSHRAVLTFDQYTMKYGLTECVSLSFAQSERWNCTILANPTTLSLVSRENPTKSSKEGAKGYQLIQIVYAVEDDEASCTTSTATVNGEYLSFHCWCLNSGINDPPNVALVVPQQSP